MRADYLVTATVVLVHGAWHGAWCWEHLVPLLTAAEVPNVAIDLPGHGVSTEPLGDLGGDARALATTLGGIDGPIVVCGHSYGGAVITQGAAGNDSVEHLVYLAAFALDVGEACTSAAPGAVPDDVMRTDLAEALRFDDDGTITLDPDLAIPALYNECTRSDAVAAASRLGAQSIAELDGTVTVAAWRGVPSTYAVCERDQAVPPALQRVFAARCTHTVSWETDHSPFFSRPDLVAELLVGLAARA